MKLLLVYLLTINALGFLLMLADKHFAKKNMRRIPEGTLLGVAALGGSLGSLGGMYLVRHKTLHIKFTLGIPLILVLQILLVVILLPYIVI